MSNKFKLETNLLREGEYFLSLSRADTGARAFSSKIKLIANQDMEVEVEGLEGGQILIGYLREVDYRNGIFVSGKLI